MRCGYGWVLLLGSVAGWSASAAAQTSSGQDGQDPIGASCQDGYDRVALDACAGLEPGAECVQGDGSRGQCAMTRCAHADGTPLRLCTAQRGQDAPAPTLPEGEGPSGDVVDGDDDALGGGCGVAGADAALGATAAWPWVCALLWRRFRRS